MKVFFIPGASLMDVTPLDDGVRVRCPGCGREEEYRGRGHRAFRHGDQCAVWAQIEEAMRISLRDEVKRG